MASRAWTAILAHVLEPFSTTEPTGQGILGHRGYVVAPATASKAMPRALRRHRQARFVRKHLRRVLRWARRQPCWTSEDVERVTRLQAANHGRCCPKHRAWDHKHNAARVAWEFPDDWDADAG